MERLGTSTTIDKLRVSMPGIKTSQWQETGVAAYSLLMPTVGCPEGRAKNWEFNFSKTKEPLEEQLVRALLNTPRGYGIERKAAYTFQSKSGREFPGQDNSDRPSHLYGQVFRREGKLHSADFSGAIKIDGIERTIPIEEAVWGCKATYWVDVGLLGDGATMLVDSRDWPKEVRKISSFRNGLLGEINTLPDVFWRASAEHLLGLPQSPSPFNRFLDAHLGDRRNWSEKITRLVQDKFEVFQSPGELSMVIWDYLNENLGLWFQELFKGFNNERAFLYPSGVYGVMVAKGVSVQSCDSMLRENLWRRDFFTHHGLVGFTASGDISVVDGDLKRHTDIELVNRHDRLLKELTGKRDRRIVREVSDTRRSQVGNTPNPQAVRVSGNFHNTVTSGFMYTDGLYLDPDLNNRTSWNANSFRVNRDYTALCLRSDTELALLARRRQNRHLGVRGDDGAFLFRGAWQKLNYLAPTE